MRQFCAKFGAKRRYLKKLAIDNQQVTDGGRVLLSPAIANALKDIRQQDMEKVQKTPPQSKPPKN